MSTMRQKATYLASGPMSDLSPPFSASVPSGIAGLVPKWQAWR